MAFFDKLGKKASEAYKITADKTGKLAKETKIKFKMGDLKSQINDIYEEIGKIVYEKHVKKEEISMSEVEEQCTKIDVITDEIEDLQKQTLELRDKKLCTNCFKEIEKNAKFCPSCGAEQQEEEVKEVEILEDVETNEVEEDEQIDNQIEIDEVENQDESNEENDENNNEEETSNLEKTVQVESNVEENEDEDK